MPTGAASSFPEGDFVTFMKNVAKRTFPLVLLSAVAGISAPQPAAASRIEEKQIETLQKRVAEQDARISKLEAMVAALLAAQKKFVGKTEAAPALRKPATALDHRSPKKTALAPSQTNFHPPSAPSERLPHVAALPVKFGGDVYLYQYVPMGIPGAQPRFELYAFSALVDGRHGPWGFHADYRFRTTKLRSYYPGNTWLQEGYVSYTTRLGQIRAGDFYRRVGLKWDGSFFGNIEYFDGLMLDPEFGVGFEGAHGLDGRLGAKYSFQYFSTDSRVNGSLPGRDFVSEPGARAKNDVTMRFAPVWNFSPTASFTLGGSFARGAIDRDGGPNNERAQEAAGATLKIGSWLAYGEVLRQTVSGRVILPPQNATYILAGTRWARGRFEPRLNFSQGNYHGLNGRREYIIQPGMTVNLADGFSFIYEYDFWRSLAPGKDRTLDRSLNFVLHYHF